MKLFLLVIWLLLLIIISNYKANALQNHAFRRKLFSAQRSVALRIVSAYRTVLTSAVLVLASVPPENRTYGLPNEETLQGKQGGVCSFRGGKSLETAQGGPHQNWVGILQGSQEKGAQPVLLLPWLWPHSSELSWDRPK